MPTLESNGIQMAYELRGDGPPLALISGVGYGGWFWNRLLPRLTPRFSVLTFDNRGAGGSDKPDGPYTTGQLAADTLGLLDALGLGTVFLFGHSLGGFIAQEVALARPGIVRRLILAATTSGGPNVAPISPEALSILMNRGGDPETLVMRGLALATAPGFAQRQPDLAQELLAYRLTGPVPGAQYAAQVMAGAQHNAESRLAQIACPTLVLFGAEDKVVPPANAELLAGKIGGARVTILPGLGHLFPIEDPALTAEAVVEFLGV